VLLGSTLIAVGLAVSFVARRRISDPAP